MEQIYDGNKKGAPGHIFLDEKIETSLCGYKKKNMSAPVIERLQINHCLSNACKKCKKIAENL